MGHLTWIAKQNCSRSEEGDSVLEFTKDFAYYTFIAFMYVALGVAAYYGVKVIYWGWQQAQLTALDFRLAVDSTISRHEKGMRGMRVVRNVSTFLAATSLIALHESFFAWVIVAGFGWSVIKVQTLRTKATYRRAFRAVA